MLRQAVVDDLPAALCADVLAFFKPTHGLIDHFFHGTAHGKGVDCIDGLSVSRCSRVAIKAATFVLPICGQWASALLLPFGPSSTG